jgi:hypothetical protein
MVGSPGDAQRIYQLIIDAGGSKAGAEMFKRAADQISEAAAKAAAAGKPLSDNAAAAEKAYTRLVARIDPVTTAQARMAREIDIVQRAFAAQKVTVDQAATNLQQITRRYEVAMERARAFSQVATAGAGSYRNFGSVVQQAGFQVGDFAVQIASGQGVLRPFIQQGTQLISMFGPWGAVIGAAGAVVGALATAFMATDDAVDEAKQSVNLYREAMEAAGKVSDALNGSTERNIASWQAEKRYLIELTEAEIAATETKIALARAIALEEAVQQSPDDIGRALDNVENVVRGKTAELQKMLDGYDVIEGDVKKRVYGLKDRLNELKFGSEDMDPFARGGSDNTSGSGASGITASIGQVTAAMEEELRILRESKAEREATKIVDQKLAELGFTRASANKELLATITALAEAQVAQSQANKDAEAADRKTIESANGVISVLAGLEKQYNNLTKASVDVRAEDLFAGKVPTEADLERARELLRLIDQAKATKETDQSFRSEIDQIINEATRNAEQRQKWGQTSVQNQQNQIALLQRQLELGAANDNEVELATAHMRAQQEVYAQMGTMLDANAIKYIQNADAIARMNQQLQRQRAVAEILPQFFDQAFDRIGSAITEATATGEISMVNLLNVGRAVVSELEQLFIKLAIMNPLKNWANGDDMLPTIMDLAGSVAGWFSGGGLGSSGAPMNTGGSSWNFRDGGVMTSRGAVPLRRYAAGGVANSPQVAMFGEGAQPEAYVPLADGRNIPVRIEMPKNAANTNAAGGTVVQIFDNRTKGGEMEQEEGTDASGRQIVKIIVRDEVRSGISRGAYDRDMKSQFGLNAQPKKRRS